MSATHQTSGKHQSHPVHPDHELYLITPISPWRCDACKCDNTLSLQEIQCYRCEQCDFDLCKRCFSGVNIPLHGHTLYRTDVRYVYRQSEGGWNCDVCRKNNGSGHHYPSHCSFCQFDLCDNCIKPWKSTFHPGHIMYKADSNFVYPKYHGTWRCDRCSESFSPQMNNNPFHCPQCEVDLCSECMKATSEESNAGISGSETRSPFRITKSGKPVASPGEEPIGRTGPPDGSGYCVICQNRPKDATIVHGETGHVCCCEICAAELFENDKLCPMCSASIERVIRYYTV